MLRHGRADIGATGTKTKTGTVIRRIVAASTLAFQRYTAIPRCLGDLTAAFAAGAVAPFALIRGITGRVFRTNIVPGSANAEIIAVTVV